MTGPVTGDWTVFLAELRGFFETCGEEVDDALAAHFGFDTAVDWITASLELVTEHQQIPPTCELPEGTSP
jgi:hypothetical protein